MGIPEELFKKTKDSAYYPPLFQKPEEIEEQEWQNPKKYKLIKEMKDLKLQAERFEVCVRNIELGTAAYFYPDEIESMIREKERLEPIYCRYKRLEIELQRFRK
jgi:hypothetical protein